MKRRNDKRGFTLVELIIVIGLLTVIAGMFVMNMIKSQGNQKEEEKKDLVAQIVSAATTYVSINPEEVKNLYEGYGYVDIPVGHMRDAGLLSEDLKDPDTGKKVSDDEVVRVTLSLGELLDIKFPVEDDANKDAWKMIADPIIIPYDPNGGACEEGKNCWCDARNNVFKGLITDPTGNYTNEKSKMYLMNNKEGDPEKARMYSGNYFDVNGVNLRVQSCDVNPSKVGNYTITYVYKDPDMGTEKTVKRVVSVIAEDEDVLSFTVTFLQSRNIVGTLVPIVQTFTDERVNVKITEYYRGDKSDTFETTIADLEKEGYRVEGFSTKKDGTFVATFSRIPQNSDGSLPKPYRTNYTVVPNKYTLTFDVDSGVQKARYNSNRGQVSPRTKIVTYEESYSFGEGGWPSASKTGYTFTGWYRSASENKKIESSEYMLELRDHTAYAHWVPNKYMTFYNVNGGDSVSQSSKEVTYDDYYGSLPTASKTGYTFLGWYTAPSGGTQVTSGDVVQITGDTIYYAHWKANQYKVTAGSTTKVVTFDSPYGPLPSMPGYSSGYCYYVFSGWTIGSSSSNKPSNGNSSEGWSDSSGNNNLLGGWTSGSGNNNSSGGWSDSSGGNISSGEWISGSGNNNSSGGWTSGSGNNNSSGGWTSGSSNNNSSGGWSDSSGGNISSGGWTSGSGNNNSLGGWTSGSSNNNLSTGRNITSGTIMKTPYDHTLQPQYTLSYCSPPPPPPPPSGGSRPSGTGNGGNQGTTDSTTGGGDGCTSSIAAAEACMQQNAEDWWEEGADKDGLHEKNEELAEFIESQGGSANYDDSTGGWSDNNGNPITWK